MSSPDLNNNRDPKAKKPKLQNKQDTKKIWGAKSVSPEVKEGPKVTSIPRAQPTMMTKVPSTAFNPPKPANAPIASTSTAAKQPQQFHSVKPAPQQKVQIFRSSDGKTQVQGLLPGQQVVQMPGGKLQIFSTTPKPPVVATAENPPLEQRQTQVVAQQLAPGAPTPPGHTPFISGGKTYTIPYSMLPFLGASALAPGAPIPPDRIAILFQGKNYTIPKSVLPTNTKSPMKTHTELPKTNKDGDVKPFICTSCKKLFNEKACQTM